MTNAVSEVVLRLARETANERFNRLPLGNTKAFE